MSNKNCFMWLVIFCLSLIIFSCQGTSGTGTKEEDTTIKLAIVNFFNESSFGVDLYKNFNPDHFDSTTLVCPINPISIKKVALYASADQIIGDVFYPRYKVLLANRFFTGTIDIYVYAQQNASNISFVIQSGKIYTKTIPQPAAGQLSLINGYIAVQNTGSAQVQILKGDNILDKLDNESVYLNPGQNIGYYEISIPSYTESLTINQLKASGASSDIKFPDFVMEQGKLCVYSFTVTDSTVSGPVIIDIDPFN